MDAPITLKFHRNTSIAFLWKVKKFHSPSDDPFWGIQNQTSRLAGSRLPTVFLTKKLSKYRFSPFFNMLFSGFTRFQNGLVELSKVYRTHFTAVWISVATREICLLSAIFPIRASIYFGTQNCLFWPLKWV